MKNISNQIKRFYFDNNIFIGGLFLELLLIGITLICAKIANALDTFMLFENIIRILLLIGLYRSHKAENIFLMNGLASGLLFCILYREANLVLGHLMTLSVHQFIMMGYKGSLYLCISMSILFLECIMVYNHFSINVQHINGVTKMKVNQVSTIMLFIMLIVQILSNIFLELNALTIIYYIISTITEGVLFVVIGHCDLIMALDRGDN